MSTFVEPTSLVSKIAKLFSRNENVALSPHQHFDPNGTASNLASSEPLSSGKSI